MTGITSELWIKVGLSVLTLFLGFANGEPISEVIPSKKLSENSIGSAATQTVTPMHKALLTQRGYIQFLRWELPVPEIEQFTFCVWVKSTNLTYPHSIFSYSKDEKERLVRAWISAYGESVHLEINNFEIFSYPTHIRENRWHHICESWDNSDGRFGLWINGQKKIDGYVPEMAGHVIADKGDIVLGQEYTDFDKGLEEGIEGAVLGFNLILASAFRSSSEHFERNKLETTGFGREADPSGYVTTAPEQIYGLRSNPRGISVHSALDNIPLTPFGHAKSLLADRTSSDEVSRAFRVRGFEDEETRTKRKSRFFGSWGTHDSPRKPLGQQLIDTGFANCQVGRGSPRIGGDLMLISWSRTPVRVFGGAIIKNAKNRCGQF